jgi:hypothetical protein
MSAGGTAAAAAPGAGAPTVAGAAAAAAVRPRSSSLLQEFATSGFSVACATTVTNPLGEARPGPLPASAARCGPAAARLSPALPARARAPFHHRRDQDAHAAAPRCGCP